MIENVARGAQAGRLELGCLDVRNVLTTDGRRIGQLRGAVIDASVWKVLNIVVDLEKPIIEEMSMKKSLLKAAKITIPVELISSISDVVQLNTDLAGLVALLTRTNP